MSARRNFNLIEIAIAMAVAGAGLTLILALFPVALKSAKASTEESYLPIVASTFITWINATADAGSEASRDFTSSNSWFYRLPNYEADKGVENNAVKRLDPQLLLDEVGRGSKTFDGVTVTYIGGVGSNNEFKAEPMSLYSYGNDGFIALFRSYNSNEDGSDGQLGESSAGETFDVVDFSATVTIEKERATGLLDENGRSEIGIYVNDHDSSPKGLNDISNSSAFNDKYVRLRLTVGWPLDAAPEARNTRVYIIDKVKQN